ncbi:hypothetical protein [Clostridium cylindrosporum]|uniref:Uncharacterized protein n=1 Tax=Clostridium cylindrosporum DSM 605 TaxID=1121307 RepID=A0A0J8D9N3_CLOCY|nr:hypothetical protein [Clostridium cylindrosporum]KMT22765.1 hypothetical protein CLCY_11c00990 [Clostridium cylindrosporum DSM 605]
MSKPSIFSSDYEQKMKRRKLNIILFLLLLVCIAFFGGRYYLKKNNINVFPDFTSKKQESIKDSSKSTENSKPDQSQKEASPSPSVLEYSYTLKNSKPIKLEYIVNGENKEFKGLKNENLDSVEFSVSPNKKYIVFVDKTDQSLILADNEGDFTDITKENVVFSSGKKLSRKILKNNKDYIWNAKPQFTTDGNIVYISDMPNTKSGGTLTLWITRPKKDAKHTKITKVTGKIPEINFEGYDKEGRLKLKTSEGYIYISKDGYTAMK